MKRLIALFFLITISNISFAANLCDATCSLVINFTNGGSIEAVAPVTLTFGAGGVLTLGNGGTINVAVQPAGTDFSAGGAMELDAGESIIFGDNGVLDLGVGGNIDYTNINIAAIGDMTLSAADGTASIMLFNMTLLIDGTLVINADVSVENNVEISNGVVITGTGEITVASAGTLTLGDGSIITSLNSTGLTVTSLNSSPVTIAVGDLTVLPLTPEMLADLEGITLDTANGKTCTVTNGECISAEGAKYVVVGGELIPAASGNGAFDLYWLLYFFVLLIVLRAWQSKYFLHAIMLNAVKQ